ncbi:hypothetical protein K474DRAFT_1708154 [Panus rudis PR-1116 ss-1]|nr:hypothetical protein K474DRAFT_1708154 [Panus rudis PR-1116 ss-1]
MRFTFFTTIIATSMMIASSPVLGAVIATPSSALPTLPSTTPAPPAGGDSAPSREVPSAVSPPAAPSGASIPATPSDVSPPVATPTRVPSIELPPANGIAPEAGSTPSPVATPSGVPSVEVPATSASEPKAEYVILPEGGFARTPAPTDLTGSAPSAPIPVPTGVPAATSPPATPEVPPSASDEIPSAPLTGVPTVPAPVSNPVASGDASAVQAATQEDARHNLLQYSVEKLQEALQPRLSSLTPLLRKLARQVMPEYAYLLPSPPEDHLHEAFRRLLLEHIVGMDDPIPLIPGRSRADDLKTQDPESIVGLSPPGGEGKRKADLTQEELNEADERRSKKTKIKSVPFRLASSGPLQNRA